MDTWLYRKINRLAAHTGWLHGPATAYAKYGIVLFGVLLAVAWWRARDHADLRREAGIGWAAASALVALVAAQLIGRAVDRARPYRAIPHVHVLISKTADFSFPSDHATAVGAVAVGLWLIDRTIGKVAVVLALLLAVTRVYVGAHYPGDVAAGLLVGGLIAVIGARPATRLFELVLDRIGRLPGMSMITGRREAGDRQLA